MRATLLSSTRCLYPLMFWKTSVAEQVKETTTLVMNSSLITFRNSIAHRLFPRDKLRPKITKLTTITQINQSSEKRSFFIWKINTIAVCQSSKVLSPRQLRSNSNQPCSSLSTWIVSRAVTRWRRQDQLQSHEQLQVKRSLSAGNAAADSWIRTDFC